MNTIKYILGVILSIPLLPILYFQGKLIRKRVPSLPEAKGNEGLINTGAHRELRLISIGESTIAGVGVDTHDEGFTGAMARELATRFQANIRWKVYAKTGYTAKKVVHKLLPKIEEKDVDIIVIGLGGNDAFTLNHPKRWEFHIIQLIKELRGKFTNGIIIFTNMPPIKEFPAFTWLIKFIIGNLVEILGQELEEVVINFENVFYHAQTITLKDWKEKMNVSAQPSDFFSDGVHPSKLTYQTWAKDVSDFMMSNEEIKTKIKKQLQ